MTFSLFYLLFLFLILEAALRVQQAYGPLYDLTFSELMARNPVSQTLNHVPTDKNIYNEDGIQITGKNSDKLAEGKNSVKILFMGDSFMQGYPPQATIPEFFRDSALQAKPDKTFTLWNAGYSSYAPLIYTVQAKKLIPTHKPDFVILTLDESDLIDDYALYHPWVQRNSSGEVTAVRPSSPNQLKNDGYRKLERIPLYSVRLIAMWLFKAELYFAFKDYKKNHKGKYYGHALSDSDRRHSFNLVHTFDESPGGEQKFSPEAQSFAQDINELFTALVKLMGDPEKILIVYHPHIHHLVPDKRNLLWKQWIPTIARKEAAKHGVIFYDTTEDLRKKFSGNPENFYVRNDMHFNEEGLKIYADSISAKFFSEIFNTESRSS